MEKGNWEMENGKWKMGNNNFGRQLSRLKIVIHLQLNPVTKQFPYILLLPYVRSFEKKKERKELNVVVQYYKVYEHDMICT